MLLIVLLFFSLLFFVYNFLYLLTLCVLDNSASSQLAAKLTHPLSQWKRYDAARQGLMQAALLKIAASPQKLSADTYEIVHRSLQE